MHAAHIQAICNLRASILNSLVPQFGAGMTLSMTVEMISFLLLGRGFHAASRSGGSIAPILSIIAVCSFAATFSIGLASICWVYTAEVFPLRLRAQALELGTAVNHLTSGLVALTFLTLGDHISQGGCFLLFICIGACSVIFFHVFAPETKGMTLEEVEKIYTKD